MGGVTPGQLITADSINNTLGAINTELATILTDRSIAASSDETTESLLTKVDENWVPASWHTVLDTSATISISYASGTTNSNNPRTATYALSGLRAGVPTIATFSGKISPRADGVTVNHSINQRTDEESQTGVFTGSGINPSCSGGFGFILTMLTDTIQFQAYSNGSLHLFYDDGCGGYYSCESISGYGASITITKIQQFY